MSGIQETQYASGIHDTKYLCLVYMINNIYVLYPCYTHRYTLFMSGTHDTHYFMSGIHDIHCLYLIFLILIVFVFYP